ncbi:unnamed protein product, partial [Meganyctiphanes norvegica]
HRSYVIHSCDLFYLKMASKVLNLSVVTQAEIKQTASIIFLHGSGDTGHGIREWVGAVLGKELSFPHIKILYPTAPRQGYTPMNGMLSTVWFDRSITPPGRQRSLACPNGPAEDIWTMTDDKMRGQPQIGILANRGFSMGGCMAFHLGYRSRKDIRGVFALSAFLNKNSVVYQNLASAPQASLPALIQFHGDQDQLVLPPWGKDTFQELRSAGVSGHYHTFPDLHHEMNRKEIKMLKDWILKHLPEL